MNTAQEHFHKTIFVTYKWSKYARVFVPGKPLQPRVIFASEAGTYMSGVSFRFSLLGYAPCLTWNQYTRLEMERPSRDKNYNWFGSFILLYLLLEIAHSFSPQTMFKLFYLLLTVDTNKLGCLSLASVLWDVFHLRVRLSFLTLLGGSLRPY
jgi:hypothetical protein